eukprot:5757372-Pyramimonas_sp.AAC.1
MQYGAYHRIVAVTNVCLGLKALEMYRAVSAKVASVGYYESGIDGDCMYLSHTACQQRAPLHSARRVPRRRAFHLITVHTKPRRPTRMRDAAVF